MMLVSIDDDDAGDDIILWKKLDQLLRPIPGALFQSLDSESGPDGAPGDWPGEGRDMEQPGPPRGGEEAGGHWRQWEHRPHGEQDLRYHNNPGESQDQFIRIVVEKMTFHLRLVLE